MPHISCRQHRTASSSSCFDATMTTDVRENCHDYVRREIDVVNTRRDECVVNYEF